MFSDSLASRVLAGLRRSILAGVATACFWLAVVLPVAYAPLFGGGLQVGERRVLLGVLLAHAVVLYLGHEGHDGRAGERDASES